MIEQLKEINLIIFLFGLFSVAIYFLFPYIYSLIKLKEGYVWVPFNNEHRLAGDNRFYFSGVQEARLNMFKYRHPCSDSIGGMAIDYTRVSSYRTGAMLGLFIPDERVAYLLSFVSAILLQYILIFFTSFYLFHHSGVALFISIFILFYYKLFSVSSIRLIFVNTKRYIKNNILNSNNEMIFDKVNDNFRYIVMSISGIYVWLTFLLIIYTQNATNGYLLGGILLFYFLILPFVYPSVTVFSLLIFFLNVLLNSIHTNSIVLFLFVSAIGFVSLLLHVFMGLLKRIKEIKSSNLEVLSMSHANEEEYKISLKSFFNLLLKDILFIVPLILLVVFSFIKSDVHSIIVSVFLVFVFIKLFSYLFKKYFFVNRFIERGGTHFLVFAIVSSVFCSKDLFYDDFIVDGLINLLALLMLLLPLIGSIKMAIALYKNNSFFMPKDEWEIYKYIKTHTKPRANFLATSFSPLQLLPAYTHANLYVRGAEWLEKPADELAKFVSAYKYIYGNCADLITEFKNYFSHSFSSAANFIKDESKLKGFHLINTLIYYPFVKKINGINLTNDNKNWTDEFLNYLNMLAEDVNTPDLTKIDYLLLEKSDKLANANFKKDFSLLFENQSYQLYKKSKI